MRAKVFGQGTLTPLDRNAKSRLAHLARALTTPTEKGTAWGMITPKQLAVFLALLYTFHNAQSGRCFPSYARIAEATHCAESTVALAIRALEIAKLITWDQRLVRARIPTHDGYGGYKLIPKVFRTSNAYAFLDPLARKHQQNGSNSEDQTETTNQIPNLHLPGSGTQPQSALQAALARMKGMLLRSIEEKGLPMKKGGA